MIQNSLAPVIIFAFNRPDTLKNTVESLQKNLLASDSELFIFVDGPRNAKDEKKIDQVKKIILSIKGFKSITPYFSNANQGLAQSIITGVTAVINKYGKAIIVEDDLYLSPSFLIYMNQMLSKFENTERVFQISGFGLKINNTTNYPFDVYFHNRPNSWGWGTWANRWNTVDWEVNDWDNLRKDKKKQKAFNQGGSDLYGMLKGYMNKQNNSWYIRFAYAQFIQQKYAVTPFHSLVKNEGFIKESTHCNTYNRYKVNFQSELKKEYRAPDKLLISNSAIKNAYKYYSIQMRIYAKIITFIIKLFR